MLEAVWLTLFYATAGLCYSAVAILVFLHTKSYIAYHRGDLHFLVKLLLIFVITVFWLVVLPVLLYWYLLKISR